MKTHQPIYGNRNPAFRQAQELVVLVHGIWMTGLEMGLLARRLVATGFVTRRFFYPSLRNSPAENARRLDRYLQRLQAERIHLVAHSLGGILLLHLFDNYTNLPEGRVVLMGSPVLGSRVAQRLDAIPGLRLLLGRSGVSGLLGDAQARNNNMDAKTQLDLTAIL